MEWTFEFDNNSKHIRVYQTAHPGLNNLVGYTYHTHARVVSGMVVAAPHSPYPERVLVSFDDGSTAEYVKATTSGHLDFARWL